MDSFDGAAVPDGLEVDLERGVIRASEDARQRFFDDPLPILQACRLVSQLGVSIEHRAWQAMLLNKMRLLRLPVRQITAELQAMLLAEHVHDAIVQCVDVLGAVMPELSACKGFEQHTPYHIYDVLEHTAWVVQRVPATPLARWSALLHDLGKPGAFFMDGQLGHFYGHPLLSELLAGDIMARFDFPEKLRDNILVLVRYHDRVIPATPHEVERMLERMGGDAELFRVLCQLKRADALAQSDLGAPRAKLADDLECVLDQL